MPRERLVGLVLVVISASTFGLMPALAVLAYRAGMSVNALLLLRFGIAALVFAPVALVLARRRGERPDARALAVAVLMGAGLYWGEATGYFTAVKLSTPALAALLLYLYPGIVALGSSLLARQRPSGAILAALGISFVGVVLSLGPLDGSLSAGALVAGVASALCYSAYILIGNHNGSRMSSTTMSAIVFASATCTYAVTGLVAGDLSLPPDGATWAVVLAIGVVCTVVPIWFFFLGMERIGPTMTSLASTLEPVGAVVGGAVVVGTRMTALQVLGAALVVVGAVIGMLRTPSTGHPLEDAAVPTREPAH